MAVNGVSNIGQIQGIPLGTDKLQGSDKNAVSFSDFLNDAINKVNDLQIQSEQVANDFAAGNTDNIHDVMIAAEKADIALQFTMQIRNKIMDAYSEIMRMQI